MLCSARAWPRSSRQRVSIARRAAGTRPATMRRYGSRWRCEPRLVAVRVFGAAARPSTDLRDRHHLAAFVADDHSREIVERVGAAGVDPDAERRVEPVTGARHVRLVPLAAVRLDVERILVV